MEDLVGRTLAHFRIVAELGRGGMGVVYEAVDQDLRRTVALKVMREDFATDDLRRRRFLREARSAAAVTHPNIATIHEVGEVEGRVYIAMELVEGTSLRQRLATRPLPLTHAVRIAQDIARGLVKAHEKGIVHRDLKPDNVMVTADLQVKVLDFGVAKSSLAHEATLLEGAAPAGAESEVTNEGTLVGTPAYMSPEQVSGGPIDQRADLFSLGVVLYEMVTGSRPFPSTSGVALLVAMMTETPDTPSKRNPLIPAELDEIISKCMSKRREERYLTARELLVDLERVDAARSSQTPLPTLDAPTTLASPRPLPRPLRAKSKLVLVLPLLAVAACAAGFGVTRLVASLSKIPGPPAGLPPPAGPTPTAITDLPPPKSPVPAAVAAYLSGLQAFRDGNFEAFDADTREALRLDPSFAAGELRMAFVMFHSVRGAVTDARAHLQKAARLRAALSERDQALLDVLEPVISREPADSDELERKLRAAVERWPLDAELLYLLANEERRYDIDQSLVTYDRVLAVDRSFMTAWRQKAQTLEMRGDVPGAQALLAECLRLSPGATGCRNERIWLNQDEGRCEEIEIDARQMIAADPESYRAYDALARAEVALHHPPEAIDEILKQAWRRTPVEVRARDELITNARRAALAGRFDEARDLGREYEAAIDADSAAAVHAVAARFLVETFMETGDVRGAARIAEGFLRRQGAWSGAPDADTGRMLRVERLAGLIDDAQLQAARTRFLAGWLRQASRVRFARGVAWLTAFGELVETKEDADKALAELPSYGAIPVGLRSPFNDEALGRTKLLAGRVDEALPPLSRAAHMCTALDDPFRHVRTQFLLGQALEAKGDAGSACDAYGEVVAAWGAARPRSVTAEKARERRVSLRCGK